MSIILILVTILFVAGLVLAWLNLGSEKAVTFVAATMVGLGVFGWSVFHDAPAEEASDFSVSIFLDSTNWQPAPLPPWIFFARDETLAFGFGAIPKGADPIRTQQDVYPVGQMLIARALVDAVIRSTSWNADSKDGQTLPDGKALRSQLRRDNIFRDASISGIDSIVPPSWPPKTEVHVEQEAREAPVKITIKTPFVTVTFRLSGAKGGQGYGLLRRYIDDDTAGTRSSSRFWTQTHRIATTLSYNVYRSGSPQMPLHRKWARNLIDNIRRSLSDDELGSKTPQFVRRRRAS